MMVSNARFSFELSHSLPETPIVFAAVGSKDVVSSAIARTVPKSNTNTINIPTSFFTFFSSFFRVCINRYWLISFYTIFG